MASDQQDTDDDDSSGFSHRTLKAPMKKLIRPQQKGSEPNKQANEFLLKLHKTSCRVNRILMNGLYLERLYTLKKHQENPNEDHFPTMELLRICMRVVAPSKPGSGGAASRNTELLNEVTEIYNDELKDLIVKDALYDEMMSITGLTSILEYAYDGILVNYGNNISCHFPSYVKKVIYAHHGLGLKENRSERKHWAKIIRDLIDGVFCWETGDLTYQTWLIENVDNFRTASAKEIERSIITTHGLTDNSKIIGDMLNDASQIRKFLESIDEIIKIEYKQRPDVIKNLKKTTHLSKKSKQQITNAHKNIPKRINRGYPKWILDNCFSSNDVLIKSFKTKYKVVDDSDTINMMRNDIMNNHAFQKNPPEYRSPEKYHDWITAMRPNILPQYFTKSFAYDLKAYPKKYLKFMISVNLDLENHGARLNQPLPLRSSLIPKYMRLDTKCVIDIFGDDKDFKKYLVLNGLEDTSVRSMRSAVRNMKELIWQYFFPGLYSKKFKDLLGVTCAEKCQQGKYNYAFNHSISTDGVSVSILQVPFNKLGKLSRGRSSRKETIDPPHLDDLTEDRISEIKGRTKVACDPGKKDLWSMVNEDGERMKYSSAQWRRESRIDRNVRIREGMRTKEMKESMKELSNYNSKTCDPENFKRYLAERYKYNAKHIVYCEQEKYRKMRFDRYIHTKRAQAKMVEKVIQKYASNEYLEQRKKDLRAGKTPEKPDFTIFYGDWSARHNLKGMFATPGITNRRLLEEACHLVLLDEYMTSKLCYKCKTELENVRVKRITRTKRNNLYVKTEKLHSLLCCPNKECGRICNRDSNASSGQLEIALHQLETGTRPDAYRRVRKQQMVGASEDKK